MVDEMRPSVEVAWDDHDEEEKRLHLRYHHGYRQADADGWVMEGSVDDLDHAHRDDHNEQVGGGGKFSHFHRGEVPERVRPLKDLYLNVHKTQQVNETGREMRPYYHWTPGLYMRVRGGRGNHEGTGSAALARLTWVYHKAYPEVQYPVLQIWSEGRFPDQERDKKVAVPDVPGEIQNTPVNFPAGFAVQINGVTYHNTIPDVEEIAEYISTDMEAYITSLRERVNRRQS